jgi:hypothetical protein
LGVLGLAALALWLSHAPARGSARPGPAETRESAAAAHPELRPGTAASLAPVSGERELTVGLGKELVVDYP